MQDDTQSAIAVLTSRVDSMETRFVSILEFERATSTINTKLDRIFDQNKVRDDEAAVVRKVFEKIMVDQGVRDEKRDRIKQYSSWFGLLAKVAAATATIGTGLYAAIHFIATH